MSLPQQRYLHAGAAWLRVTECMAEALRPDDMLAHVAAISRTLPLAERLIEAVEVMRGHVARMGAVAGAMAVSGHLQRGAPPRGTPRDDTSTENPGEAGEKGRPSVSGREAAMDTAREVLTGLFEPDRDRLRLPPERLADAFQLLVQAAGRGPAPLTAAELVDLFLHGAMRDGAAG
ncbi:TetR family transcriptional regulator [Nonomuraea sp. B12E4]|uniref:TetR family transcriptional regulator n=1 Tax=Nonomuraea sp. B12E4 TaxID=3153564 RepID=UPI00325EAE5F